MPQKIICSINNCANEAQYLSDTKNICEECWNDSPLKRTKPSEKYILTQRKILAFDEWGLYLLLVVLFFTGHTAMLAGVAVVGGAFVLNSYRRQWNMERDRFNG
tara:strand:- start:1760 stop:2071 length:312 start_codon:yes stop_codon:yes gene_type:complete